MTETARLFPTLHVRFLLKDCERK